MDPFDVAVHLTKVKIDVFEERGHCGDDLVLALALSLHSFNSLCKVSAS